MAELSVLAEQKTAEFHPKCSVYIPSFENLEYKCNIYAIVNNIF